MGVPYERAVGVDAWVVDDWVDEAGGTEGFVEGEDEGTGVGEGEERVVDEEPVDALVECKGGSVWMGQAGGEEQILGAGRGEVGVGHCSRSWPRSLPHNPPPTLPQPFSETTVKGK